MIQSTPREFSAVRGSPGVPHETPSGPCNSGPHVHRSVRFKLARAFVRFRFLPRLSNRAKGTSANSRARSSRRAPRQEFQVIPETWITCSTVAEEAAEAV
jgi:hypothetical protein